MAGAPELDFHERVQQLLPVELGFVAMLYKGTGTHGRSYHDAQNLWFERNIDPGHQRIPRT